MIKLLRNHELVLVEGGCTQFNVDCGLLSRCVVYARTLSFVLAILMQVCPPRAEKTSDGVCYHFGARIGALDHRRAESNFRIQYKTAIISFGTRAMSSGAAANLVQLQKRQVEAAVQFEDLLAAASACPSSQLALLFDEGLTFDSIGLIFSSRCAQG